MSEHDFLHLVPGTVTIEEIPEEKPKMKSKPKKKKINKEELQKILDEFKNRLDRADSRLYKGESQHGRAEILEMKTLLGKLKVILEDL